MSADEVSTGERLKLLLVDAGLPPLEEAQTGRFEAYLSLILRWNTRINLTAVRDEDAILSRHFIECIACARALSSGITTLLDLGSGAGLPGIPIAVCRPEIAVTLAESQGKKAAFLQEAVRVLGLTARVHSGRAETLTGAFDCVILRAVDKMAEAVKVAASLVAANGELALMTTGTDVAALQKAAGASFSWADSIPLPGSESRILALGTKSDP
jgi:16S rRNA (guanine527-N7)-methyltransferase